MARVGTLGRFTKSCAFPALIVRIWPMWAAPSPQSPELADFSQFRSKLPRIGRVFSKLVDIAPDLVEFAPDLVEFARTWPAPLQNLPILSEERAPQIGQHHATHRSKSQKLPRVVPRGHEARGALLLGDLSGCRPPPPPGLTHHSGGPSLPNLSQVGNSSETTRPSCDQVRP